MLSFSTLTIRGTRALPWDSMVMTRNLPYEAVAEMTSEGGEWEAGSVITLNMPVLVIERRPPRGGILCTMTYWLLYPG
jgi:hypothetical protein